MIHDADARFYPNSSRKLAYFVLFELCNIVGHFSNSWALVIDDWGRNFSWNNSSLTGPVSLVMPAIS